VEASCGGVCCSLGPQAVTFAEIFEWIRTFGSLGLLALATKFYLDLRRVRANETERDQNYQLEVSADGRSNLQFIIDNLKRDIEDQRAATDVQAKAHERCEDELRAVRVDNRSQGMKLDGLSRQFIAFSESVGQAIPPENRSPAINAMMKKLEELAVAARDSG
jgi:hypothetical protein